MWLPSPKDEAFRAELDAIARLEGLPTSSERAKVAEGLRRLSATYNRDDQADVSAVTDGELAARLHFSLVRDAAKGAAAVRELAVDPALRAKSALEILDLGAGLGAMSLGALAALRHGGVSSVANVHLVDSDPRALRIAERVVSSEPSAHVRFTLKRLPFVPRDESDIILVGQVLSELDRALTEAERIGAHAAFLASLVGALKPGGYLVVVEPALRSRSRHLQAVRREVLTKGGVTVFSPCLHQGACPLLERESDWCHEDLPIDLPEWLVPLARDAGLRYEGLTFAYLVLRREGEASLRDRVPTAALRLVSNALRSKGKVERDACLRDGLPGGHGIRLRLLERDTTGTNEAFQSAPRGTLFSCNPPVEEPRVRGGSELREVDPK